MKALPLLVALALAGCSHAASAVISGPKQADVGEIVILDASGSTGQVFEWQADDDCRLKIAADQRSAIWVPGAKGKHTIRLRVASAACGTLSVDETEYQCSVGDEPTPGPGPTPDATKLEIFVRSLAAKTSLSATSARQLSLGYLDIAAQIESGRLTNAVQIQGATLEMRARVTGPAAAGFLAALDDEVRRRLRKDSPMTEFHAVYQQISYGLR